MPKNNFNIQAFLDDLNANNLSHYTKADLQIFTEKLTALTLKSYDKFAESYLETVNHEDLLFIKQKDKEAFAKNIPAGGKILVLAAGCGSEISFFKKDGFDVSAIEPSKAFTAHLSGHKVCKGTLTDLSTYKDATFDGVFCHAGILHLPDIQGHSIGAAQAFAEASRVLKAGGHLFQHVREGTGAYIQKETGRFFQMYSEERLKELGREQKLKTINVSHIHKAPLPENFKEWMSMTYQKES